jgi:hypothetical protein
MRKYGLIALMTALMSGVVIIAWIAGHSVVSFVWAALMGAMLLQHLDRKFGWSLKLKLYLIDRFIAFLKSKDKGDLTTLMEERHKQGVDRITKVR